MIRKPLDCRACGAPIGQRPTGRTRHYCCDACRQRWCRLRRQKRRAAKS